jgi:hypothetical protein
MIGQARPQPFSRPLVLAPAALCTRFPYGYGCWGAGKWAEAFPKLRDRFVSDVSLV